MIAIESDTSLTVDSAFQNAASGKTAKCFPSTARFVDSGGNNPVIVSDQGLFGIGTLVPPVADQAAMLHIHSSTQEPLMLVFSNDEEVTGGMALTLVAENNLKQLDFSTLGDQNSLFAIGKAKRNSNPGRRPRTDCGRCHSLQLFAHVGRFHGLR